MGGGHRAPYTFGMGPPEGLIRPWLGCDFWHLRLQDSDEIGYWQGALRHGGRSKFPLDASGHCQRMRNSGTQAYMGNLFLENCCSTRLSLLHLTWRLCWKSCRDLSSFIGRATRAQVDTFYKSQNCARACFKKNSWLHISTERIERFSSWLLWPKLAWKFFISSLKNSDDLF